MTLNPVHLKHNQLMNSTKFNYIISVWGYQIWCHALLQSHTGWGDLEGPERPQCNQVWLHIHPEINRQ